jgi:glycosyltransferase involved in cell wall biosynthesis
MKIVHLTIARQLTHGQTKQLRFEYDAAQSLDGASWTTIAYHNGRLTEPYMLKIPLLFRGFLLRQLWGWIVALRLSRSHDFLLMRHMTFDPFAFVFAAFINNRVSIHHAKEVEELRLIRKGWKGHMAAWFELISGKFAVRHTRMVLGVTQEIANYERDTRAPLKGIGVYPNGIELTRLPLLADRRKHKEINAAFMCGTFSEWHGLDKLIEAVDSHYLSSYRLVIHLIGRLSSKQIEALSATEIRRAVFKKHGHLNFDSYIPILEICDFGIASLALYRKNLNEASTLKVREMLALGLPVYSGHKDVALNESDKFVLITDQPSVSGMITFAIQSKGLERGYVRKHSANRIDKRQAMQNIVNMLKKI